MGCYFIQLLTWEYYWTLAKHLEKNLATKSSNEILRIMNAIATFVTEYELQVIQRNGKYEELVRIWSITNYTIATSAT